MEEMHKLSERKFMCLKRYPISPFVASIPHLHVQPAVVSIVPPRVWFRSPHQSFRFR